MKVYISSSCKVPYANPTDRTVTLPTTIRSEKALLVVRWWLDHEVAHIIWTPEVDRLLNRGLVKCRQLVQDRGYTDMPQVVFSTIQMFWNVVEDARIENLMKTRFPGSGKFFRTGAIASGIVDLVEGKFQEWEDQGEANPIMVAQFHAGALLNGWHGLKPPRFVEDLCRTHFPNDSSLFIFLSIVDKYFAGVKDVRELTADGLVELVDGAMAEILDLVLADDESSEEDTISVPDPNGKPVENKASSESSSESSSDESNEGDAEKSTEEEEDEDSEEEFGSSQAGDSEEGDSEDSDGSSDSESEEGDSEDEGDEDSENSDGSSGSEDEGDEDEEQESSNSSDAEEEDVDPYQNSLQNMENWAKENQENSKEERVAQSLDSEESPDTNSSLPYKSHIDPRELSLLERMPGAYFDAMHPCAQHRIFDSIDMRDIAQKTPGLDQLDSYIRKIMPSDLGVIGRRILGRFRDSYGSAYSGNRIDPRKFQSIVSGNAYGQKIMLRRNQTRLSKRGVAVTLMPEGLRRRYAQGRTGSPSGL